MCLPVEYNKRHLPGRKFIHPYMFSMHILSITESDTTQWRKRIKNKRKCHFQFKIFRNLQDTSTRVNIKAVLFCLLKFNYLIVNKDRPYSYGEFRNL